MKDSLENALEDILTIKNSIGETKSNFNNLFKILLILGIINLISYTSGIALMILGIPIFMKYALIQGTILKIIYIVFFIYFIKIYRQEKTSSNKYYLGFLTIFGGVTFLLPLFMFMINILSDYIVTNEKLDSFWNQFNSFSQLSNILLLCVFIIICSYILKKKSMIVISAVIVFGYLIISLIYHDVGFEIGHSTTTQAFAFVTVLSIYYNLVTSFGYIVTAIILKHGMNKANGVN